MKKVILVVVVLSIWSFACALEKPNIHSSIMLDARFYQGDSNNAGDYNTTNRYQIRKAALNFSGILDERTNYSIEMGVSTCTGSGDTFRLMEAELMYNFAEYLAFGIKQGHIMRGFCFHTECTQRLSIEKPWFQATFAACHPLGMVGTGYLDLTANTGLQYEVAILNGVNGTLSKEHDYNLGLMFDTPIEGLALSGSATHAASQYFDENYQEFYADGHRWGTGAEYRNNNIWLTGEYYGGKGFTTDKQEMTAWYTQAGYGIDIPMEQIEKIEPWIKYECWDQDSSEDAESEYDYLDLGVNVYLTPQTMLRAGFSKLVDKPSDAVQTPETTIIRLQTDF